MVDIQEVRVPDLGGYGGVPVIEMLVALGDEVAIDQGLVALESDKATLEVPSSIAGVIRELKVEVGDALSPGDVIALVEVAGEMIEAIEPPPGSLRPNPSAAPPTDVVGQLPARFDTDEILPDTLPHASPAARLLARRLGANLALLRGTARGGRISRDDIQQHVDSALSGGQALGGAALVAAGGEPKPLPWPEVDFSKFGEVEKQPLGRIQTISAANLARNWAMIPHVTQHHQSDITDLEALRVQFNKETERAGVTLTLLAFLVKASAAALKQYPRFKSSLDAAGETLTLKQYCHIGFAADTPDGLVVPVIRDADSKGLIAIAQEVAALTQKARNGELGPADMEGGCFSISSLGGTVFTPIINAPEAAILGVSQSSMQPIWDGQAFQPRLMLPLSLSYDHRIIDGAAAARFTATLAELLDDIRRVLL